MVLIYLFYLFIYQTSSVRSEALHTLSISQTPNVCTEALTSYISPSVRLIEHVNIPTMSQESGVVQESPKSIDTSNVYPFKSESMSTKSKDPYLQPIEAPFRTMSFSPSTSVIPQVSAISQINLCNLEIYSDQCNVVPNDCTKKSPPIVQSVPAYFVLGRDNYYGNTKIPLPVNNLPSNICKIKVTDLKPTCFDSNKQNYKTPVTLSPVNPIELQNLEKPYTPLTPTDNPYLIVNDPNNLRDVINPQASSVNILKDNPMAIPRPNDIITNKQCINTVSTIEPKNTEIPTSTNKKLYPISNIVFNYGSNNFNSIQKVIPENFEPCAVTAPKVAPMGTNVGLTVTPVINELINAPQSIPSNVKSPENTNINVNSILKPETTCSYSPTLTSPYIINQANVHEIQVPTLPISQLPIVNTIGGNSLTLANTSPTLINPIPNNPCGDGSVSRIETAPDSFTSYLSSSLNSIVSLLTSGILSKLFDSPDKSVDTVPIEPSPGVITFKIPLTDTQSCINTQKLNVPNTPLPTYSLSPESVNLPNPTIGIELQQSDSIVSNSLRDSKISSTSCPESSPKRKPYLASITINIIPSTEASNDIIIIV